MRFILIPAFILFSLSVFAEEVDKRNPVEKFQGTSNFQLMNCELKAKLTIMQADSNAYKEISDCGEEAKMEVKKLFPKASSMMAKKPAAQKALKEYYIAWIAAIEGIKPDFDELKVTYEKRQGESARRVKEMWSSFEIEAGL